MQYNTQRQRSLHGFTLLKDIPVLSMQSYGVLNIQYSNTNLIFECKVIEFFQQDILSKDMPVL